jgi:hypothetical protein
MCTVKVLAAWVVFAGTVAPFAPPHERTPELIPQVPSQPVH